jgi:hypothetical protein
LSESAAANVGFGTESTLKSPSSFIKISNKITNLDILINKLSSYNNSQESTDHT